MGVYSDVLAPPSFGFWFVTVVGAILTVGPILWQLFTEVNTSTAYDNNGRTRAKKTSVGPSPSACSAPWRP